MIVRPPQKKSLSNLKLYPSFSQKVANDNQAPKKAIFGWVLFGVGACFLVAAFLWI